MTNERGFKVVAVGECMLTRKIRMHNEPEFTAIKDIMEDADVCFGHLGMTLGEYEDVYPYRAKEGDGFLMAPPYVADELKWMGIDMVSLADSHSTDFGPEGVLSTIKTCREKNLVSAGSGGDIDEAREARYYEGDAGRFALVSASSGAIAYEWTNKSKGYMLTRPGVNPMRVKTRYILPPEDAAVMREVGHDLKVMREYRPGGGQGFDEGEFRIMLPSEQSTHGASGNLAVFKEGDSYSVESMCHESDLSGNIASIVEAKNVSNFAIVSHNYSIADNVQGDEPPKFAQEFAHAAIDAGADAYFGSGWHKILGVEIYKGKPIFYGLGNFFAQAPFMDQAPYEASDSCAYSPDHKAGCFRQDIETLTSVMVELKYDPQGMINEITFYPLELGLDLEREDAPVNRSTGEFAEGRPLLAKGKGAERILERVTELSKEFGTDIKICGDIARWSCDEKEN